MARTKPWSVKRLREELEEKGFRLTFHKNGELVNIQKSYEVLYDLSRLTEAEQNILEAFSVFPYIPLSADICNQWLLADAGVSEDDDVLMGLYQKGWLQFDMEQESYTLHPVFAQFIYEKCRPRMEKHRGMVEACQKCLEISKDGLISEWRKVVPLTESIIKKVGMKENIEQAKFISMFAKLLSGLGEYKRAEKWFKKSLEVFEGLLEEDNCNIADIYDNLGQVYLFQSEYVMAEEMYGKSIKIHENIHEEQNNGITSSYNGMAFIYQNRMEYEKAEALYEKILSIYEKEYEKNESEIATIYNNLAGLYRKELKYRKAEKLHIKCLNMRQRLFGENDLHTAISYRNLAGIYLNMHRYGKAQKLYEKSLSIYEVLVGKEHPDAAYNYNDLGVVYYCTGRYKKAETYFLIAYKIGLGKLGESHPFTQTCYSNMYMNFNLRFIFQNKKFERWLEEQMK